MIAASARSFAKFNLDDLDDFVQEGEIGFMYALQTYDPARETKFSSWAMHCIRGHMLASTRKIYLSADVPRALYDYVKNSLKVATQLANDLGRHPTDDEVARAIGEDPRSHQRMLATFRSIKDKLRLDRQRRAPHFDRPNMATLADTISDGHSFVHELEIASVIAEALANLHHRYRHIIEQVFFAERGLAEIGQDPQLGGVSESRVSQLLHEALRKLRELAPSIALEP